MSYYKLVNADQLNSDLSKAEKALGFFIEGQHTHVDVA